MELLTEIDRLGALMVGGLITLIPKANPFVNMDTLFYTDRL
jgi:hypothetical protein